jgi:hypothetical protein
MPEIGSESFDPVLDTPSLDLALRVADRTGLPPLLHRLNRGANPVRPGTTPGASFFR